MTGFDAFLRNALRRPATGNRGALLTWEIPWDSDVRAAPGLHGGGGTSFVAKNAEFVAKKRMDKGEEHGGI
jgi:hypothetical protein